MPQRPWTGRRECRYLRINAAHTKAGLREDAEPDDVAGNVAAHSVNRERARHGVTKARAPLGRTVER